MEFSRLFTHIGEAISSSGSRRFPRMMYSLIFAAVPIDGIRLSALAVDGDLKVRSIGAVGETLAPTGPSRAGAGRPSAARTASGGSHLYVDDTLACPAQTHALLERFFDTHDAIAPPPGPQFHLASGQHDHCYLISLYRANAFDDFSPQERTFLKDFSRVLFPIVASHVAALDADTPAARSTADAAAATQTGRERLARRFAERLRQAGVKLSTREIEACTALLSGDTVSAIARRFALRESTVETYLKRAAVKLGFGGRHGLTRWMLDEAGDGGPPRLERASPLIGV
ncbi:helix-turn-helix transcriptional regulator [Burkholderia sp. BE17]|uniref:helix-turn-helix transcriptional regulator n=1 Tax=Burkholderia sp. BE17 TaxID=2656644 RepID=UPI00128C99FF|nr:LuxR C-terminal-related transcriptional regulator [Burkholderia sp. BE17]MPV68726.1 LuxR family transcriptional regulator [Burkholderia sp. BE17]